MTDETATPRKLALAAAAGVLTIGLARARPMPGQNYGDLRANFDSDQLISQGAELREGRCLGIGQHHVHRGHPQAVSGAAGGHGWTER